MKTAEEWINEWDKSNVSPKNIETHLKILRAIQLDALQEAARVAEHSPLIEATYGSRYDIQKNIARRILSLINQLTKEGK